MRAVRATVVVAMVVVSGWVAAAVAADPEESRVRDPGRVRVDLATVLLAAGADAQGTPSTPRDRWAVLFWPATAAEEDRVWRPAQAALRRAVSRGRR